ncbi:hypothetical protein BGW38_004883 [Lunasporangiospora selenospora]|uniref:NYN domain-containing protein n=1 Tax=Lunasporangiospora selenospora TaxID=979761 RepID=A0A9P6FQN8_9FUNG|nr:hypothetical protein BGW38_004883 [Lunasporangiospora selenospora]
MAKGSHLLPRFDYELFFELCQRGEYREPARRLLVGSSPLLQELDEALRHQYETIILRRVKKFTPGELGVLPVPMKPLMAAMAAAGVAVGGGGTTMMTTGASTFSSSSITPGDAASLSNVTANGEQCVDELLHLKMLETILDHEPGMMVVATGDGGDSEFGGGGFYKVIKRALDRGWHIEMVSWEEQLSGIYLELALEYGYTPRKQYRSGQHYPPHRHGHGRGPGGFVCAGGQSRPFSSGSLRVICLDWIGEWFLDQRQN